MIRASAGSGKTFQLTNRYIGLMAHGVEPERIIALTFTRKAAAEMQIRLSQRLFEMATADEAQLEAQLELIGCTSDLQTKHVAAGLYEKLTHSLYPIRIQTFHSFCQDILSRFPLEADIPPGFELLEDTSLLARQAWHALFDAARDAARDVARDETGDKAEDENSEQSGLATELDTIMQVCNGPDNTRTALNSFLSHRSDWWAFTSHSNQPVEYACQQLAKSLELDSGDIDKNLDKVKTVQIKQFFDEHTIVKLQNSAGLLLEINLTKSKEHASYHTDHGDSARHTTDERAGQIDQSF